MKHVVTMRTYTFELGNTIRSVCPNCLETVYINRVDLGEDWIGKCPFCGVGSVVAENRGDSATLQLLSEEMAWAAS